MQAAKERVSPSAEEEPTGVKTIVRADDDPRAAASAVDDGSTPRAPRRMPLRAPPRAAHDDDEPSEVGTFTEVDADAPSLPSIITSVTAITAVTTKTAAAPDAHAAAAIPPNRAGLRRVALLVGALTAVAIAITAFGHGDPGPTLVTRGMTKFAISPPVPAAIVEPTPDPIAAPPPVAPTPRRVRPERAAKRADDDRETTAIAASAVDAADDDGIAPPPTEQVERAERDDEDEIIAAMEPPVLPPPAPATTTPEPTAAPPPSPTREPSIEPTPRLIAPTPRPIAPTPTRVSPAESRANAADLYRDGAKLYLAGQLEPARKKFVAAIAANPAHAPAHRGLGLVLERKGDSARAARALRTYLKLAPTAGDAASIRARLSKLEGTR